MSCGRLCTASRPKWALPVGLLLPLNSLWPALDLLLRAKHLFVTAILAGLAASRRIFQGTGHQGGGGHGSSPRSGSSMSLPGSVPLRRMPIGLSPCGVA